MPAPEQIERVLAEVYAAGVLRGDDGREFPVYPTGVDAKQGRELQQLVASEGAARAVEIGFALGLSCLHICAGLLRSGGPIHHLAIDPTETSAWGRAGWHLVEQAGLETVVELVELESQYVLPPLVAEQRHFDIAFIDGDHRFDPVFLDLFYAIRLVRPGGLVIVDDMWMPAVRLAVSFFETNVGVELVPDRIPGGFRWSRRRLRRSVVRAGAGETAVLRVPAHQADRSWDHFARFW
jgi:predicted O-methyltransferase YrrM